MLGTVTFRNTYRFEWLSGRVRVYHERQGADKAVWLVDLIPSKTDAESLISESPHLCGSDIYNASIRLDTSSFKLDWEIKGPSKNEYVQYFYN